MSSDETTQAKPTQPRPVDPGTGRQLDEYGLPLSGPARVARLAELGKPDPREDPEAWRAGEKPLGKQNKTELLATAEAEGVVVPDGTANADIVNLIEAKRAAASAEPKE